MVDSVHSAATGFSLRYSLSGSGVCMSVAGVISPYVLSGLAAGTAFDVQLQSVNAAGTSAWSATTTLGTATAAPNAPGAASGPRAPGSALIATWATPATDNTQTTPPSDLTCKWSPLRGRHLDGRDRR